MSKNVPLHTQPNYDKTQRIGDFRVALYLCFKASPSPGIRVCCWILIYWEEVDTFGSNLKVRLHWATTDFYKKMFSYLLRMLSLQRCQITEVLYQGGKSAARVAKVWVPNSVRLESKRRRKSRYTSAKVVYWCEFTFALEWRGLWYTRPSGCGLWRRVGDSTRACGSRGLVSTGP